MNDFSQRWATRLHQGLPLLKAMQVQLLGDHHAGSYSLLTASIKMITIAFLAAVYSSGPFSCR
jgi:hypothetical protein